MTTVTKDRKPVQTTSRAGQPAPQPTRVAVVVVHGMGEQRPMETLRGLATSYASAASPADGPRRRSWSVPDRYDCTFELHGFVVEGGDGHPQVDLYEGYWAAGMQGTKLAHVGRWARQVLVRLPSGISHRVQWLWWTLLASALTTLAAVVWIALTVDEDAWWLQVAKAAVGLVLPVVTGALCRSLGDVARYLDSHPDNVGVRFTTRNAIVGLLDKLHESGRYERIVVIGHSLGGLVAYDAVRLLWASRTRDWNAAGVDDAAVALRAAELSTGAGTFAAFDEARGELFRTVNAGAASPWLVSDLVTVGSPVAYPTLFLATPKHPLTQLVTEREVPTSPPQPADPVEQAHAEPPTFRYPSKRGEDFWLFHHAALFCLTRWTNVYAGADFVGGPVQDLGGAVQNICLSPRGDDLTVGGNAGRGNLAIDVTSARAGRWSRQPVLSHTRYWSEPDGIELLRRIIEREPAGGRPHQA